ncbi:MAG: Uncharacterized protein XD93_0605 [candidate division WS6 bacterium 34_10]|uniref:Uncharacterized protein n=1 Tax=candidate division WS6 bacterium 34_10 TaxID=1641389 RepID=A0A101HHI5_9BACT|nr:MAG: Uncharacterized protein XD93_0605 [candidate division WS6 bacterium 34_10]
MATIKQKKASKKNIKKAQKKWKSMTKRQRAIAQPQGRKRAKPGTKGKGDYYRIVVRDKNQFSSFKTHDVGDKGGIQRIAGHRPSGSWDTQAWLISKKMAKKVGDTLESIDKDVKKVLKELGSKPKHLKGDIFEAKPRPNVPEKDKPTKAQQNAREKNIKKAQKARWN